MNAQDLHACNEIVDAGWTELDTYIDPLCGAVVEGGQHAVRQALGDDVVYFCSDFCRHKFLRDHTLELWLHGVSRRREWNHAELSTRRSAAR